MGLIRKSVLPALIASALATTGAWAQEQECVEMDEPKPGLYTTTDEGATFIIKDDKIVELSAGESGFASEDELYCIEKPPTFMDWPCSTQAAQSRRFATYRFEELPTDNPIEELVRRYFEVPEVIEPIPNFIDGEYHATFSVDDIIQFSTPDYWYRLSSKEQALHPKRPRLLLISLYVGINKVMLDNNMIEALQEELGSDAIPVNFVFSDSNVVPVSYFGDNVSLEEILEANRKRGIKIAEPPMWWLGDYHFTATAAEYEEMFEIPPLDSINPDKAAKLRADLEAYGFNRKPIFVNLFTDSGTMAVDQPQRVRVAMSMGYDRIPTAVFTIEPDLILARCGPGTPVGLGDAVISGESTPVGGSTVPPGQPVVPPPPEPPASESG